MSALDALATLLGLIKKQCVGVKWVFVCARERERVCEHLEDKT